MAVVIENDFQEYLWLRADPIPTMRLTTDRIISIVKGAGIHRYGRRRLPDPREDQLRHQQRGGYAHRQRGGV